MLHRPFEASLFFFCFFLCGSKILPSFLACRGRKRFGIMLISSPSWLRGHSRTCIVPPGRTKFLSVLTFSLPSFPVPKRPFFLSFFLARKKKEKNQSALSENTYVHTYIHTYILRHTVSSVCVSSGGTTTTTTQSCIHSCKHSVRGFFFPGK